MRPAEVTACSASAGLNPASDSMAGAYRATSCGLTGAMPGVGARDHQRTGLVEPPQVRLMPGSRTSSSRGGASPGGGGSVPDGAPTTVRRSAMSRTQVGGRVDAVLGQNETCSIPSTPAATASAIASSGVGVRGDLEPVPVGLVDRGPQFLRGELGQVRRGARGEGAAAGHDLDDVDAALACSRTAARTPAPSAPPPRPGSGSARREW